MSRIGGDCKLYYNSAWDPAAGTFSPEVFVEIDEVGDVNLADFTDTAAEVLSRASDWVPNLLGKTRSAIEFPYIYKANASVFDFLRTNKFAKTSIDMYFMDGDITGDAEGLRVISFLEQFPINQPLEDVTQVDQVRAVPALAFDDGGARINPSWQTYVSGTVSVQAMNDAPEELKAKSAPQGQSANPLVQHALQVLGGRRTGQPISGVATDEKALNLIALGKWKVSSSRTGMPASAFRQAVKGNKHEQHFLKAAAHVADSVLVYVDPAHL